MPTFSFSWAGAKEEASAFVEVLTGMGQVAANCSIFGFTCEGSIPVRTIVGRGGVWFLPVMVKRIQSLSCEMAPLNNKDAP